MTRTIWAAMLAAMAVQAGETAMKTDRTAHLMILKEVYLNGQGPFRMMVDTGAATCSIRPQAARRAGVAILAMVERVTATGVDRVPLAQVTEIRVGSFRQSGMEAMVTDLAVAGVDGVLGQNWLVQHDYLLDYRGQRLVIDPAPPERGVKAALHMEDGRPEITAEVDGRRQLLVVDSGASALVLFGKSGSAPSAMLTTHGGSTSTEMAHARVRIEGGFSRIMTAAAVASAPAPGLLPTSAFASVYVPNRDGVVVLTPR